MKQKTIRDYGIVIGELTPGAYNKITDVPGVKVGHATVHEGNSHTGVTVILPCEENIFAHSLPAAQFVWNGFGKTLGLMQIEELGKLETPIALTNTLNVGLVHDALVEYMVRLCESDGTPLFSVNPVVGECNDSSINDIRRRAIKTKQVLDAIASAEVDFEMGSVGAGTSTICHYLKGGIGSASRVIALDGKSYTLGVLVQSNYGRLKDFTLCGKNIGREIEKRIALADVTQTDQGSIMMILATDLPLSDRQLKRVIKRMSVGLARLGSYVGHGSGEVMIGFSTANKIEQKYETATVSQTILAENQLDLAFRAAAECCEEAVLNSMITADAVQDLQGKKIWSLKEFEDLL